LEEAGYEVRLVGPKEKEKYTSKEGYWAFSDTVFASIDPAQVKCLIIPGTTMISIDSILRSMLMTRRPPVSRSPQALQGLPAFGLRSKTSRRSDWIHLSWRLYGKDGAIL
jgi:hypothetical protein